MPGTSSFSTNSDGMFFLMSSILVVSYPALVLTMLRSLYKHRFAVCPAHRIAINEASSLWRLLYLNNNYHVVHH